MRKIRLKTIFLYVAIMALNLMPIGCGQSQETPGEEIIESTLGSEIETKLESIIKNVIEVYDLPGLAIGIVKDGKIAYARGFGYKNIVTRAPITAKTLFHMASISKPFVATAIMQLVEQGKIDLEAPVTEYLPDFLHMFILHLDPVEDELRSIFAHLTFLNHTIDNHASYRNSKFMEPIDETGDDGNR